MDQQTESLTPATAQLDQEIAACHGAIMTMFQYAEKVGPYDGREYLNVATRMLRAQTSAVALFQRLKSGSNGHTFTYIHEGKPPLSQKIESEWTGRFRGSVGRRPAVPGRSTG